MIRIMQTVRVCIMGIGAAQLGSAVIHHVHEVVYAARNQYCDGIAGIVARFEHEAVQQIHKGHFFTGRNRNDRGILRNVGCFGRNA